MCITVSFEVLFLIYGDFFKKIICQNRGNGITLSVRLQYVSFSHFNYIPEIDEKGIEKTERFKKE